MDPSLLNYAGPSNYGYNINASSQQQQQQPTSYARLPHGLPPSHVQMPQTASYPTQANNGSFPSSPSPSSIDSRDQTTQPNAHASSSNPNGNGNGHNGASGSGPLVEPFQDLNEFLESFWTRQMDMVEREEQDGKVNVSLPLARIKKVMKSDEEVKMISAEVPIMFSKACEVFISELTCRAWLIAESHKRRTLQKSDVAAAIAFSDMFDFLIDIVPREDGGGDGSSVDGGDAEGREVEGESKAQSLDDEEAGEGDEGEDLYREFVGGDD